MVKLYVCISSNDQDNICNVFTLNDHGIPDFNSCHYFNAFDWDIDIPTEIMKLYPNKDVIIVNRY